jgi:xanthine dehydrogenase molybdopterin-binding subunit B
MSQLVKTKRQANFKDFKGFGAFKGLVKQKNVVFNSFACKLGFFWHETRVLNWPTHAKKAQFTHELVK